MEMEKILTLIILSFIKPAFSQVCEFPLYESIDIVYKRSNIHFHKNLKPKKPNKKKCVLVNRRNDCKLQGLSLENFSYIQFDKFGENGKEPLDTFDIKYKVPKLKFLEIGSSFCYFNLNNAYLADGLEYFFSDYHYESIDCRNFKKLKKLKYLELNADSINAFSLNKLENLESLILNSPLVDNFEAKGLAIDKLGLYIGCNSSGTNLIKSLNEVDSINKLLLYTKSIDCIRLESILNLELSNFQSVAITVENYSEQLNLKSVSNFINSSVSKNSICFKNLSLDSIENIKERVKENKLEYQLFNNSILVSKQEAEKKD